MSEKKEKQEKNEEDLEEEEEEEPPRELTDEEKQQWIRDLPLTEGCFDSPIDLNLVNCIPLKLPNLVWVNFEVLPKKTKITNTGHTSITTVPAKKCAPMASTDKRLLREEPHIKTVIYSAKWNEERPYICEGPFTGKYVFSNFHLHWGETPLEGSEHTIDGGKYPAEMHVVFFKSCYLTQEAALKEQDGCATLAYLFKMQDTVNPGIQVIIDSLKQISDAGSSFRLANIYVLRLFREFIDDYYMYWGSVSTQNCIHYVLWLITRKPIGISYSQLDALHYLLDDKGLSLTKNYRKVQPLRQRSVFHVNPSQSLYATLLPLSHDTYLQYQVTNIFYYKDIDIISKVVNDFLIDPKILTQDLEDHEPSKRTEFNDKDECDI